MNESIYYNVDLIHTAINQNKKIAFRYFMWNLDKTENSEVKLLCEDYFKGLFDYSVGNKVGCRRKPYPDSVLETIEYFGIDFQDAIYIGDSEVDNQTGRNAGIEVALVTWGFREEEFLRNIGADV